jgi:hypothetical protein
MPRIVDRFSNRITLFLMKKDGGERRYMR